MELIFPVHFHNVIIVAFLSLSSWSPICNPIDFCLFFIPARKSAARSDRVIDDDEDEGNRHANEYFNDNEDGNDGDNDEDGEEDGKI